GETVLSRRNRFQVGRSAVPVGSAALGSGGYLARSSVGDKSSSIATLTVTSLATGTAGIDLSAARPLGAAGAGGWTAASTGASTGDVSAPGRLTMAWPADERLPLSPR